MYNSILDRRKMKVAALGLALTAPISGFESISKGGVTTPGDLVVEQVGNGSAALTSVSTAVFLDIFKPAVSGSDTVTLSPETTAQLALPTTLTSNGLASNPLTTSGSASSEGEITVSSNGATILVPGYDANVGTTGIASSNSTTDPRGVALVSTSTGAIDTSTTTTGFNGNNIRSAVLFNSTTVYAAGATTPGVTALTVDANATTNGAGVELENAMTNIRQLEIFGGTLYLSDSNGSALRLASITGFNGTANSATTTELAGLSANNASSPTGTKVYSPYSFAFANNANTLYLVDEGSGGGNNSGNGVVEKFILSSGTYTQDGFVNIGNDATGLAVESLTGSSGSFEAIFATNPSSIYEISDTGGSIMGDTLNTLEAAGTNEGYRGIVVVPEPTTLSILALAGCAVLPRRRRRRPAPEPARTS